MHVNVSKLKQNLGDKQYFQLEESLSSEVKQDVIEFVQPVKVSLDVINCGSYLQAKGTVTIVVRLNCGRCLESYEYPVETEFNENYYLAEVKKTLDVLDVNEENTSENDGNEDNEEKISFTGDSIDIEPEVFSSIQLSLPMQQVCSAECRGLCPRCGVNLNNEQCDCQSDDVDPRMAMLQRLFNK